MRSVLGVLGGMIAIGGLVLGEISAIRAFFEIQVCAGPDS